MLTRVCRRRSIASVTSRPNPLLYRPIGRDQFPVEPSRAVAADLLVEIKGREDSDGEVPAPVPGVIGHAALGDIGGDFPAVGGDTLDMAGAAQSFQPANMRADVSLRIAADPLYFGAGSFQMGTGAIDAGVIRMSRILISAALGASVSRTRSRATICPRPISSSLNDPRSRHSGHVRPTRRPRDAAGRPSRRRQAPADDAANDGLFDRAAVHGVLAGTALGCVPAWNKDSIFGVIGIQSFWMPIRGPTPALTQFW